MKRSTLPLIIALLVIGWASLAAQVTQNPILFVTQVPTPVDSLGVLSVFGGHLGGPWNAPRGGDLWIRYPDGTLKNLTQAAGYGMDGQQGANAIAVREPSVHWNGAKAVFSMVVGAPTSQGDNTRYYWQVYEITGLGKNETPVISKVPNQPATFNNVSPIYGTDDKILFTSDRPRTGEAHLYPQFDEYKMEPTIAGLYSLDPATGDLALLDHSPSGDFSPIVDSYGRLIFIRWDHLQRDGVADRDVLGQTNRGTFNYADESAGAAQLFGDRTEYFPEPQGGRTDLLAGTNVVPMEFNIFIPWQINEDGTEMETMNHIGRHELRQAFNRNINDDPQVVPFNAATSGRANTNAIVNLMQIAEDPTSPGTYYCIDAPQMGSHGGGQVVTLKGAPTLDPNQMGITYITDRATSNVLFPNQQQGPNHTGLYRTPLPTTDGKLIVSHSPDARPDSNLGTRANPLSRYTFRVKTLKKQGNFWVPDQMLTSGITKSVTYWDPDVQASFNGTLWELYPVEVRSRTRPARRGAKLPAVESQVFTDEEVNEASFRDYLKKRNLAVVISRNVTYRDKADKQQPFNLRIAGTATQSPNPTGKAYDIKRMTFFQADQVRGFGKTSPGATPVPGRRVIARPMHDPNVLNPTDSSGVPGAVRLGNDGSMAAFVPARRAMTWLLEDNASTSVVRERYWVTFQPGELRSCASCHGTNGDAAAPINTIPQNKPQALRDLLRYWKSLVNPSGTALRLPADNATGQGISGMLQWHMTPTWDSSLGALNYRVQLSADANFTSLILDTNVIVSTNLSYGGLAGGTRYYWRARTANDYAAGPWSAVWSFTTLVELPPPPAMTMLIEPANGTEKHPLSAHLRWHAIPNAATYQVQLSKGADFKTLIVNAANLSDSSFTFDSLGTGTTYFWRARGTNAGGDGPWSETWRFTTETPVVVEPPAAIVLATPVNGATAVATAPHLTWTATAHADTYRAQIAAEPGFASPMIDTTLATAALDAAGFAEGTTYFWRVRGTNTGGDGAWSEIWRFTTTMPVSSVAGVPLAGYSIEAIPNPATGRATLHVTLPRAGYLSLKVFDILGNEVATLADGPAGAGERVYTYEPPAPGVYFCRAQSGAYVGVSAVRIVR